MRSRLPSPPPLSGQARTYVVLWRLPFGAPPECIPLGTVVAATPASARLVAVARWPAARASLVVRAARAVPTGVLMHALAWDATAPR